MNHPVPAGRLVTVVTTAGSMEDARVLARSVVEAGLAACVQLDEMAASIYRWEGKLCEEPEVRLTMKTLPEVLERLVDFVSEHHPYELPQLVWAAEECSAAYGAWIRSEVKA